MSNKSNASRQANQRYKKTTKGKVSGYKYRTSEKGRIANRKARRKCTLKQLYGVTLEQYDKMFEQQDGKCAICNQSELGYRLCIDHDHKTGRVRGLLCHGCNLSLGHLEKYIANAVLYLEVN